MASSCEHGTIVRVAQEAGHLSTTLGTVISGFRIRGRIWILGFIYTLMMGQTSRPETLVSPHKKCKNPGEPTQLADELLASQEKLCSL